MKRVVDFNKPRDIRQWIDAMRAEIEDVADLVHEASKPKRHRTVSGEHVRAEMARAVGNLGALLHAGRRGLPRKPPATH